jgi:predicted NBD/HSP70 family sugar kinase
VRDVSSKRATVRDLRRVNRAAVLRPLFLSGPLNRVVLARLTGLSSGSVTNVVSDLLREQLVIEAGTEESDGGRPRALLQINPEFGVVIGVDVGETGVRVESFDLAMEEVAGATVSLHPQEHEAAVLAEAVAEAVNELRSRLGRVRRRILGVGVAVPGVVEHAAGEALVHAPSIGWAAVPLARLLREQVELPVFVENGAKTLGQAEMWLGAGRGAEHAIVTLWGTGVGAAIFTSGSLYRGVASSAGEWGHTCIVVGGERCRCGATGCLEAYIGAEALVQAWAREDDAVSLPAEYEQEEWIDRLLSAVSSSDAAAQVLDRTATYFGAAAANLANLFNPERIILGGWVGLKLGPSLLPRIREALATQALEYPASRVSVELGELGPDAVALGASTVVVEELLASGGRPPDGVAASHRRLSRRS